MSSTRRTGEFCWINVLARDDAAERDFFAALFNWTYVPLPSTGHRIKLDGRDVGSIFPLTEELVPAGTPPGIGVMVKVASADATVTKAAAVGGKSRPATDVGPQGRMAELVDPNGAMIDVWEPKASGGMDCDARMHGAPSWIELLTTDLDRAAKFYADVFGWRPQVMPKAGSKYLVFKLGQVVVGAMRPITEAMGPTPPHWAVHFTVEDVELAAATAEKLGGTVFQRPVELVGVGRTVGLRSPAGVRFFGLRRIPPSPFAKGS